MWQDSPCATNWLQDVRQIKEPSLSGGDEDVAEGREKVAERELPVARAAGSLVVDKAVADRQPASIAPVIPSGRRAARQCDRADGGFYFTLSACGSSPIYDRTLVTQRIVGIGDPDRLRNAVIVSGTTAIDVHTGERIPLEGSIDTYVTQVARQVPDRGKVVDRRWACKEARRQADVQRRERHDLGFSGRRALDDQVWDMCNSTRRLDR
ncbi:MAG: hypothetical protein R3F22_09630 [Lysobacteraceae bacterium]